MPPQKWLRCRMYIFTFLEFGDTHSIEIPFIFSLVQAIIPTLSVLYNAPLITHETLVTGRTTSIGAPLYISISRYFNLYYCSANWILKTTTSLADLGRVPGIWSSACLFGLVAAGPASSSRTFGTTEWRLRNGRSGLGRGLYTWLTSLGARAVQTIYIYSPFFQSNPSFHPSHLQLPQP